MTMSDQSKQSFDVVIVGGGMVGASLSLLLDKYMNQGLSVALVDAFEISQHTLDQNRLQQPSFDERTTAISLGSKRLLDKLDVWGDMSLSATAIQHIQVSQQKQFGRVRLHAVDENVEALGYVVENKSIGRALQTELLKQKTLSIYSSCHVVNYEPMSGGVKLDIQPIDSDKTIQLCGRLLVLADGASSEGCRQLGIEQIRHDYQQQAIVCNISVDKPHDHWAFERFTSQGPLALLPISQNRYAVVWCMKSDRADQLMAQDSEVFISKLQSTIGFDKGRITKIGERHHYPLSLVQAREQIRSNLVVLGNAAHALHPVAGQGFNLALRDARALANAIGHQLDELGKLSGLVHYLNNQKHDQALTTGISHTLPLGFASPGCHWSLLRGVAMSGMDVLPAAKTIFANQAMGLVGKHNVWNP